MIWKIIRQLISRLFQHVFNMLFFLRCREIRIRLVFQKEIIFYILLIQKVFQIFFAQNLFLEYL